MDVVSSRRNNIPYSNLEDDVESPAAAVAPPNETSETGEGFITVKIRKLDASQYMVQVHRSNSVQALKNKISEVHGPSANLQRLIFSGRELQDTQVLSECNIENDSVIHLVMRQFLPEVRVPDVQNGEAPPNSAAVFNVDANNGVDISSFYVSRICRVVRSFAAINGFFFLIFTLMTANPIFLLGVMGCACGFYGAKYLRKCYLFIYVFWLTIEILFRVFFMAGGNMLIWFFTMIMVCLDFYIMRHVLRLNRLISYLPQRQIDEILEINQLQQRGLF